MARATRGGGVKAAGAPAEHPSFLELERHALGAARSDVGAHLAACAACRERLPRVDASAVPTWARALGPRRRGWGARLAGAWSVPRALLVGGAAFAGVAALWVGGAHAPRDRGASVVAPETATKGAPDVRLFIKRGERVEPWDGSEPVVAGDLLRLEVRPEGFPHISVFEVARDDTYARIYDAAIAPRGATALPTAWRVDATPGTETLLVVLGPDAISPAEAGALVAHPERGRHWWRLLKLAKAAAKAGAAP
jgi:hypothetical protein